MEILHVTHPLDGLPFQEPSVMALGFFDGVHLGHQCLLQKARVLARQAHLPFTVMTFDPHPSEIIEKTDRRYLTPLPSKLERLASFGADKVYIVRFNPLFASLQPSEFIRQYIVGLNVKHVVVGFDYRFGCKAAGDVQSLKNSPYTFDVTVIPKRTNNHHKISSTTIRKLINDGDVHLVPYYLGNHYEIGGRITFRKQKRVYFYMENKYLSPKPGVYQVEITNGLKSCPGLLKCYDSIPNYFELMDVNLNVLEGGEHRRITVKLLNQAIAIGGAAALV